VDGRSACSLRQHPQGVAARGERVVSACAQCWRLRRCLGVTRRFATGPYCEPPGDRPVLSWQPRGTATARRRRNEPPGIGFGGPRYKRAGALTATGSSSAMPSTPAVRCLDCGVKTFAEDAATTPAACCSCGGRRLECDHPSSIFDQVKGGFVCSWCGAVEKELSSK